MITLRFVLCLLRFILEITCWIWIFIGRTQISRNLVFGVNRINLRYFNFSGVFVFRSLVVVKNMTYLYSLTWSWWIRLGTFNILLWNVLLVFLCNPFEKWRALLMIVFLAFSNGNQIFFWFISILFLTPIQKLWILRSIRYLFEFMHKIANPITKLFITISLWLSLINIEASTCPILFLILWRLIRY